jgi:mono/diheme cytochrome c family protein
VSEADVRRGQERYQIYCVPCHDPVGNGRGKIVERGFLAPPNFHLDNSRGFAFYNLRVPLREVPPGYIFEVISKGYGGMPDYASQIPIADRWRIAAYVRVLQLSQNVDRTKLTPEQKAELDKALGGQR